MNNSGAKKSSRTKANQPEGNEEADRLEELGKQKEQKEIPITEEEEVDEHTKKGEDHFPQQAQGQEESDGGVSITASSGQ